MDEGRGSSRWKDCCRDDLNSDKYGGNLRPPNQNFRPQSENFERGNFRRDNFERR